MFEQLSDPFPIAKQLNRVARYVSKLYPDFKISEYWRTQPRLSSVSYHIHFNQYTLGALYQDEYTNDVILALNTTLQFNGDFKSCDKIIEVGSDLVVKYLECIPLLNVGKTIIFKVTREDIPNV